MSKNMNMNTLDRYVRALLVAPIAIVVGILIGPGSAWRDRALCARRHHARDQRKRLLPAVFCSFHWSSRGRQSVTH